MRDGSVALLSPWESIMETDRLNTLVTDAIWRAEELETRGISAQLAWAEVSSIEEDLAKAHPVSGAQGRIARRGAVRAALKAGDYTRAQGLVDRYIAEDGAPESLKTELADILEEDARMDPGI
jgi:hypothetical protein